LNVRCRRDPIDKIAGHRSIKTGGADRKVHSACVRREEDCGLAGGISSTNQNDIASCAQVCFDWRCPIRDAGSFEPVEIFDFRSPVACTRCDHDRSPIDRDAVVECNAVQWWPRTIEFADRDGDCKLCTEFLRLYKCACRQRLPGDAGWKSEIVLDPRGSTGL